MHFVQVFENARGEEGRKVTTMKNMKGHEEGLFFMFLHELHGSLPSPSTYWNLESRSQEVCQNTQNTFFSIGAFSINLFRQIITMTKLPPLCANIPLGKPIRASAHLLLQEVHARCHPTARLPVESQTKTS